LICDKIEGGNLLFFYKENKEIKEIKKKKKESH